MPTLQNLHLLVRSLSKSEKRYFSMSTTAAPTSDFVRLYQLMEKNERLNETEWMAQLNLKSLEAAQKHLYEVVLKCLRNFNANRTVEYELTYLLQDSRILLERGLLDLCAERLKKMKALAIEHEKFAFVLMAIRIEQQLLTQTQFKDTTEAELIAQHDVRLRAIQHEYGYVQHSALYEIVLYRFWRQNALSTRENVTQLNDLLLGEFQVLNSRHYNSFESQKMHLHFQSQYFLIAGDYKSSLLIFKQLITLFEENRSKWEDTPIYFVYVLDGILLDLRQAGRFEEMSPFIAYLQTRIGSLTGVHALVRWLGCCHQLHQFLGLQAPDQAYALALEWQKNERFMLAGDVPFNLQVEVLFLSARSYFERGDLQTALKTVNQFINHPTKEALPHWPALYYLLRLMIHFELTNFDFLAYEVRSVRRKFKKAYPFLAPFFTFLERHGTLSLPKHSSPPSGIESDFLNYLPYWKWAGKRCVKN